MCAAASNPILTCLRILTPFLTYFFISLFPPVLHSSSPPLSLPTIPSRKKWGFSEKGKKPETKKNQKPKKTKQKNPRKQWKKFQKKKKPNRCPKHCHLQQYLIPTKFLYCGGCKLFKLQKLLSFHINRYFYNFFVDSLTFDCENDSLVFRLLWVANPSNHKDFFLFT